MADVSRLVLQVDASVELARRNISALAAAVDGDTKKMDTSLKRVDDAHARLGRSSGAARIAQMELTHVIAASTDAYNAGIPVQRIFAMEMGRITEAVQLAGGGGALGGFAKFLGGPWGIALQVGVGLLTSLAMSHQGAGKGAEEHKSEEQKLADAIKEVSEATKNLNDNELVTIQRHFDAARAAGARAAAERETTKTLLERARAEAQLKLDAAQGSHPGAGSDAALAAWSRAQNEVTALDARLTTLNTEIATNQHSLAETELKFAHIIGDARTSPQRGVEVAFQQKDILLNQDFRRRTAGRDPTAADRAWLIQQEAALATQREAGMRAAQAAAEAERRLSDNRQQGRQVTLAEAESIVRGIGGVVTSAQRSTAQQAQLYARHQAGTGPLAAAPGHSFHETGQALDIAKGGGMSLGRIRQAFQERGVQIRELLDEGNHFHVAFGKAGPSAEQQDRSAQAAADRKRRDQESFGGAQAAAAERLAQAQEEGAKHDDDLIDVQTARIQKEREALDEATRRTATEHHWSQADLDIVLELNKRWAAQKVSTAVAQDEAKKARDRLQIAVADVRNEEDVVRARAQLAETTKQRRDSALLLLDLSQQQERLELEATLASKDATAAQKQIARARLATLGELHGLGVEAINRQYEGAGKSFLRQLNAQDINEQLDEVKVRGLQGLEDELTAVISGTESVSSAFKRMAQSIIADLARIAIEKEIIQPLANMLFGGGGGLGSLFGGGGNAAQGASLLNDLFADTGGGFAAGGDPPVGRVSLVGEKGPELFIPKTPGTIIPNHMLGRGGRGGTQVIYVAVDKSEYFDTRVQSLAGQAVVQAAPSIAAGAHAAILKSISRPGING